MSANLAFWILLMISVKFSSWFFSFSVTLQYDVVDFEVKCPHSHTQYSFPCNLSLCEPSPIVDPSLIYFGLTNLRFLSGGPRRKPRVWDQFGYFDFLIWLAIYLFDFLSIMSVRIYRFYSEYIESSLQNSWIIPNLIEFIPSISSEGKRVAKSH